MGQILTLDQSPDWRWYLEPAYAKPGYVCDSLGKWVYHDNPINLARIAEDLSALIVLRLIPALKFRPTDNPPGTFFGYLPPICVYASAAKKDLVEQVIRQYGLNSIQWQTNEDTAKYEQFVRENGRLPDSELAKLAACGAKL